LGLGLAGVRGIGEQEVHEVFGERLDGSGGKRVHVLHRHFVFNALRDNVAQRTTSKFTW
jgi:hypothetical protein